MAIKFSVVAELLMIDQVDDCFGHLQRHKDQDTRTL